MNTNGETKEEKRVGRGCQATTKKKVYDVSGENDEVRGLVKQKSLGAWEKMHVKLR